MHYWLFSAKSVNAFNRPEKYFMTDGVQSLQPVQVLVQCLYNIGVLLSSSRRNFLLSSIQKFKHHHLRHIKFNEKDNAQRDMFVMTGNLFTLSVFTAKLGCLLSSPLTSILYK